MKIPLEHAETIMAALKEFTYRTIDGHDYERLRRLAEWACGQYPELRARFPWFDANALILEK